MCKLSLSLETPRQTILVMDGGGDSVETRAMTTALAIVTGALVVVTGLALLADV